MGSLQGIHGEDLAGCILESVLTAMGAQSTHPRLGRVRIGCVLQVLQILQLLELLVVPYMCVIGGQAHQIVYQTENDQHGRHRREDEHHLGLLHEVLAEKLDLLGSAHLHILRPGVVREQEGELSEINAVVKRLDTRIAAQAPEYGKYERGDDQKREYQKPDYLQDIDDGHENSAGDTSAYSGSPCAIDFVSGGTSCEATNAQDHESQSCHASADRCEYQLQGFQPSEMQMEHLVHHESTQCRTSVHGTAEYPDSQATHYGCYESRVWHSGHAIVAHAP